MVVQFGVHDFVIPAKLLNRQPSQQLIFVQLDDIEHIMLLFLILVSKKKETNEDIHIMD